MLCLRFESPGWPLNGSRRGIRGRLDELVKTKRCVAFSVTLGHDPRRVMRCGKLLSKRGRRGVTGRKDPKWLFMIQQVNQ